MAKLPVAVLVGPDQESLQLGSWLGENTKHVKAKLKALMMLQCRIMPKAIFNQIEQFSKIFTVTILIRILSQYVLYPYTVNVTTFDTFILTMMRL